MKKLVINNPVPTAEELAAKLGLPEHRVATIREIMSKPKRRTNLSDEELARTHAWGTTQESKVTVVMKGARYAVFRWPGEYWSDNGGRHYGQACYCLALQGERRFQSGMCDGVLKEWEGRVSKKVLAQALKDAEESSPK